MSEGIERVDKLVEETTVNSDVSLEDKCGLSCNNVGGYVNYVSPRMATLFEGGGNLAGDAVKCTDGDSGGPDVPKEVPIKVVSICPGSGRVRSSIDRNGASKAESSVN